MPIDVVGGTSIEAVMAALCAQGFTHDERVERSVTAFTRSGRLIRPTLPLIALSSGRRVDRLLADHLGAAPIEDLPRRFFCVSANLTRAEEVVHERGALWRAVRASLSLPGLLPPVYADGDLLVDGAVLDNVPAGVMRARIGSGSVVAVDLLPEVESATAAPFDLGLSGWLIGQSHLILWITRGAGAGGYCPVRRARSSRRMVSSWRRTLAATASRPWRSWSIWTARPVRVLASWLRARCSSTTARRSSRR